MFDEQLGRPSGEDVWVAAQAEGRFLVTHDLDFSDTRKFEPGKHAGVLIVRLPDSEQWRVGDHLVGWRRRSRDRHPAKLEGSAPDRIDAR